MILSKSKIYELKLFKDNLKDKNFSENYCVNKDRSPSNGLFYVSKRNYRKMIKFFMKNGARTLKYGMYGATNGGHEKLVRYFVCNDNSDWYELVEGMYEASKKGHAKLIDFFILKGVDYLDDALHASVLHNKKSLVHFFMLKGAYWKTVDYSMVSGDKIKKYLPKKKL